MKSIDVPLRTSVPVNWALFFFLLVAMLSCKPKVLPTVWQQEDVVLTAKFSHQSTRDEIEKVQRDLAQSYGITFSTDGSSYLGDDHIQDLVYRVTTPSGISGKAVARLTNLQYTYYGFRLEKQEDEWVLVKIGQMSAGEAQ